MKANHIYSCPAQTVSSNQLPVATQFGHSATDVLVIYSITANVTAGAADGSVIYSIEDSNSGEVYVQVGKTILANENETIHAAWPCGIPIHVPVAHGSGSIRSGINALDAGFPILNMSAGTTPAGGLVTVCFAFVHPSLLR